MDRAAILRSLLGQAYGSRHRNCYWLAAEVQKQLFGRDLPLVDRRLIVSRRARSAALQGHPARAEWPEVPGPRDGALVLMGLTGQPDTHCGTFLADLGGVLHTDAPHGVVFDPVADLSLRWPVMTFHLPANP